MTTQLEFELGQVISMAAHPDSCGSRLYAVVTDPETFQEAVKAAGSTIDAEGFISANLPGVKMMTRSEYEDFLQGLDTNFARRKKQVISSSEFRERDLF